MAPGRADRTRRDGSAAGAVGDRGQASFIITSTSSRRAFVVDVDLLQGAARRRQRGLREVALEEANVALDDTRLVLAGLTYSGSASSRSGSSRERPMRSDERARSSRESSRSSTQM
jgi:hypothetical protein